MSAGPTGPRQRGRGCRAGWSQTRWGHRPFWGAAGSAGSRQRGLNARVWTWPALTYPADRSNAEAMRVAAATGVPPIPRSMGSIGTQEFGEEFGGELARHGRAVGADGGGGAAGQHLRNRRGRVERGAASEAGQDDEGEVVDDIVGRVGLHNGAISEPWAKGVTAGGRGRGWARRTMTWA